MNKTLFAFVLYGNPVTKKNSPVMVKGRSVLLPSEAYRKYEGSCRKALQVLKVQEKLRHFWINWRLSFSSIRNFCTTNGYRYTI